MDIFWQRRAKRYPGPDKRSPYPDISCPGMDIFWQRRAKRYPGPDKRSHGSDIFYPGMDIFWQRWAKRYPGPDKRSPYPDGTRSLPSVLRPNGLDIRPFGLKYSRRSAFQSRNPLKNRHYF